MSGERIFWSDKEKRDVAAEALAITHANPGIHMVTAVERAQRKVVSTDRQRNFNNSNAQKIGHWITPLWEEMRRQQRASISAHALFDARAPEAAAPVAHANGVSIDTRTLQPVEHANGVTPKDRKVVFWKDDEKRAIVAKALELMARWPDMKKVDAFRKAQELVIPALRQRDIAGWSVVAPWADPLMDEARQKAEQDAIAGREAREARERAEHEAHELAQQERRDAEARERAEAEAEIQHMIDARVEAGIEQRLRSLPLETLIRTFATSIAREAVAAFGDELENSIMSRVVAAAAETVQRAETAPAPDEHLVMRPTNRLPRVGVVGLTRQQSDDVERAFRGRVEFVFVKTQEQGGHGMGGHVMLDKCSHCDAVVAMLEHTAGDVPTMAKKLHVPFKQIAGSVSNLKRWLSDWLNGDIALKAA